MTQEEFIEKTNAKKEGSEFVVYIPLFDETIGKLYVKDVDTEFDAQEKAFLYLNKYFENKRIKNNALDFLDWLMENCELANDNSLWSYDSEDYTNERLFSIWRSQLNP